MVLQSWLQASRFERPSQVKLLEGQVYKAERCPPLVHPEQAGLLQGIAEEGGFIRGHRLGYLDQLVPAGWGADNSPLSATSLRSMSATCSPGTWPSVIHRATSSRIQRFVDG